MDIIGLLYLALIVAAAALLAWVVPGSPGCDRDCNQGRNCNCWRGGGKE